MNVPLTLTTVAFMQPASINLGHSPVYVRMGTLEMDTTVLLLPLV